MRKYLIVYGALLPVFGLLDYIWLGLLAPGFYQSQIGSLLLPTPLIVPAAAFYLMYPAALIYFCLAARPDASIASGALRGALFGAVAYATYDLSNWATLKGWSSTVAMVDIVWGAVASGIAMGVAGLVWRVVRR